MKKIILLSAGCFLGSVLFAQTSTTKTKAAPVSTTVSATPATENLSVDKTEHNFGKIPQGKPVTTVFAITNKSNKAFKLDNVQASCGCTTPIWDREKTLQPGESTLITVGYNAAAEGPFAKPVTITYNTNETKQLIIKGAVFATPAASAPVNEKVSELEN